MVDAESKVQVRRYRRDDRDGFATLVCGVLGEYGFAVDALLEADLEDPASHYLAIWVATDDGQVVGSVAMRLLDDGHTAELKRMYILPAYRGRGLGRRLLRHAINWARVRRCDTIVLDTSKAMTQAQNLYRNAGFKESGTRTEQGAVDARCEILLTLDLTGSE
jgi:ribosomal protein S18 acetylase RimI-like enzyme